MSPLFYIGSGLVIAGVLALIVSSIWLIVLAFRESVAWGMAALLVPFGKFIFSLKHPERVRLPLAIYLLAFVALGGSYSTFSGFERHGGKVPSLGSLGEFFAPAKKTEPSLAKQGMFKAAHDADLDIKLVNLHTRETELLQRKAELAPGDRAGAARLAAEIRQYNADLAPALAAKRERDLATP